MSRADVTSLTQQLDEREKEHRREAAELIAFHEARRTARDRAYATQIDALIAKATKIATGVVDEEPSTKDPARHTQWAFAWNRAFHRAMDELAKAKGLRMQTHQA